MENLISDTERRERLAEAAQKAVELSRLESALRTLAAVPVRRLPELLLEVVDVYAFRVDAWVTSLASARLTAHREAGGRGARLGGYGWVHDLRPPLPREQVELPHEGGTATVSAADGYIHAPSLHHAATAAVLRSGFLAHPGEETFAVDLSSRRARVARWLLGGVRNGQNLGALLGYRLERALHDAELDSEIPPLRRRYGAPTSDEPATTPAPGAGDLWATSTEAITARNVVDGMKVARDPDGATSLAADPDRVGPIIDDLVDALDAVGDLVLAESVHHLLGGSPLRAGVAADTLGRGGELPDEWQTLRTPHRARAITNRVAVLLPPVADPAGPDGAQPPTGWPADSLAGLDPALEAWVAGVLGPAAEVVLTVSVDDADPARETTLSADRIGLGALSTVLDAAGSGHPLITDAARTATGAGPGAVLTLSGDGWRQLRGLAVRLRSLLVAAQPLLPRHLLGERTDVALDLTGASARLSAFAGTAVSAETPGADALLRVATTAPTEDTGGPEGWLTSARAALAEVLGVDLPLRAALVAIAPGTPVDLAPSGRGDVTVAETADWLRQQAEVRPAARALHELTGLARLRGAATPPLRVAQHPPGPAPDGWIGGTFPLEHRPPATTHLAWLAAVEPSPSSVVSGLLLDEWTELLPGSDHLPEASAGTSTATELTGLTFRYDRPDAKPPHAVLVAVPPDEDRGWTDNVLLQVVRETAELATLRAVCDEDVPRLRPLLPAIRIPSEHATGQALARFETFRPGIDEHAPYRLQPRYSQEGMIDAGLAARVHDPLWLLTRQWQFGEFAAQDAGSPAVVEVAGGSAPLDAWRPAGTTDWRTWHLGVGPLDAQVESEPVRVDERLRIEGGLHLLAMLDAAGLTNAARSHLAEHLMPAGDPDGSLVDLTGGLAPDALGVATALDAGTFDPGGDSALRSVTGQWRAWWAAQVADAGPDCFDPHRFEHAADLSTAGVVLSAQEYLGDGLEWYSFDIASGGDSEGTSDAAPAGPRQPFAVEALPTTIRYGGLPADRFWEMEDARVDLGSTAASALDTGRLLLVAFATVYGNDWFLVPLEVPTGSLTTLRPGPGPRRLRAPASPRPRGTRGPVVVDVHPDRPRPGPAGGLEPPRAARRGRPPRDAS